MGRGDSSGECEDFVTAEELLDYPDMDAVLVAIPHYDHPKYVMEALKRGFHAMCEKPAGVYTKQVREMNEELKKKGFLTIPGRVSRRYFEEKFYGLRDRQ